MIVEWLSQLWSGCRDCGVVVMIVEWLSQLWSGCHESVWSGCHDHGHSALVCCCNTISKHCKAAQKSVKLPYISPVKFGISKTHFIRYSCMFAPPLLRS